MLGQLPCNLLQKAEIGRSVLKPSNELVTASVWTNAVSQTAVPDRCSLVSQQVEEANGWMLLKPAMSSFKHAFAVEESHRGFMRGLKSISNTEPYPGSSSLYDTKVSRCN